MKILNLGSMNLDYFYKVKEIVKPGETISSSSLEIKMGGKGLNQSIALSRNFSNLYHAGLIGKDGIELKNLLDKNNIDTTFVEVIDTRTGNAIIQLEESGENSIVLYPGANYCFTKEYIDKVLENFTSSDYLVIQNEINNIDYIIDRAFEKKMKIFLNPSPITDSLLKSDLSKVYMFILNEQEALKICEASSRNDVVNKLIEKFPNSKFVMTKGKNGSLYFDKEKIIEQKAYSVNALDTTGAGDTFTGFFITSFIKGEGVEKALDIASIASALCVTKKGASNAIPAIKDVLEFKERL